MSDTHAQHQGTGGQVWRSIRKHARVRVILPIVVGVGLIAYVVSIAVAPKSGGEFWAAVKQTWWLILLLTVPYLAIRALVWRRLLKELGIKIPWRPLVVSFAAGEMTKALPAGIYVENFLLARLAHFRTHGAIRSSMATTATLGLESLVAVPIALVVGLRGEPWVFWTLIGLVAAWVLLLVLAWLLVRSRDRYLTPHSPAWLRSGTEFADEFLEAGGELLTWRTLVAVIPTALYMLIYVVDLYAIIHALGIHNITFVQTMSIYAFMLLTVILIPIPTEIGLTEFSGLAALLAYGIPQSTAAVIVLSLRALATGATILVAGIIVFVLRDELRNAEA